jgi:hypothetical protein
MKAEERKELKTNTLVATMERVKEGFKEGPSRRTVVVLGIVALVVLLWVVWRIAAGMSDKRNSNRWEQLASATSPDDFGTLLQKDKNTIQGRAARLQLARADLAQGLTEIYNTSDHDAAVKRLQGAAAEFEQLAKEFKSTPILVQECLYGAAQAREASGDLKQALALYEELTSKHEGSPLAKQAEADLKRLKDDKKVLDTIQQVLKK